MDGPTGYVAAARAVREAATAAGRPVPLLSARLNVRFGREHGWRRFAIDGTPTDLALGLERFRDLGVSHVVLNFGLHEPDTLAAAMTRFDAEVVRMLPGAG